MRTFFFLSGILCVIGAAILIGAHNTPTPGNSGDQAAGTVPHIGKIEVQNGCGAKGAGNAMAEFLRRQGFDVKSIGNAATWNYPFTMVISRTQDMSIARRVAESLHTDAVVLLREPGSPFDATVIIGPEYEKRIQ